ncbi:metallophosphatase family protein, partial [bacterium]|nr:metallophosphatase family protein [bacterium]
RLLLFLLSTATLTSLFFAFYNKSFNSNKFTLNEQFLPSINETSTIVSPPSPVLTLFVLSDTHLNQSIDSFLKEKISLYNPDIIFHVGDHTDFGDPNSLSQALSILKSFEVPFMVLPGDRDIAYSADDSVFRSIFDKAYSPNSILNIKGIKFFLFSNMYNFNPFSDPVLLAIKNGISESDVIISSQPIFVHSDSIFSNKYMGSKYYISSNPDLQDSVKNNLEKYINQSDDIRGYLANLKSRKLIISGDHHKSDTFTHPSNSLLNFHIVGALAENIESGNLKLKQSALQSQRFE